MATVQPGSQERCHGFHGVPKSGRLETRARCSAALQLALAFPQIISSVLMLGVWNFSGWECLLTEAPIHPPKHTRIHTHWLNTIPCCVHGIGNHLLIHAFWGLLFDSVLIFSRNFFLGEWIYVNERKSVRKENDYLAWRSEGSLHVPADMYIITEWDWGLRVLLALTWERGLHPEIYLEASCG